MNALTRHLAVIADALHFYCLYAPRAAETARASEALAIVDSLIRDTGRRTA